MPAGREQGTTFRAWECEYDIVTKYIPEFIKDLYPFSFWIFRSTANHLNRIVLRKSADQPLNNQIHEGNFVVLDESTGDLKVYKDQAEFESESPQKEPMSHPTKEMMQRICPHKKKAEALKKVLRSLEEAEAEAMRQTSISEDICTTTLEGLRPLIITVNNAYEEEWKLHEESEAAATQSKALARIVRDLANADDMDSIYSLQEEARSILKL